MKRLAALLLAMVLCVSLAACGDKDEGKYDDIIAMLEAGKYDEAIAKIQEMQPEDDKSSTLGNLHLQGGIILESDKDNGQADAEAEAMIPLLMGQWELSSEEDLPKKWVFREDGTCNADDTQLQWESKGLGWSLSDTQKRLNITVFAGNEKKYTIHLIKRNTGELGIACVEGDSNIVNLPCNYIKPEHYEIIELTMDNWQEYFEWTTEQYCDINSLGDISRLGSNCRLTLKDEFYTRLGRLAPSSGGVEIAYMRFRYDVTVDFENKTYTASQNPSGGDDYVHTSVYDFTKEDNYFGTYYASEDVQNIYAPDERFGTYCSKPAHVEVKRIQGTLYLLKTS